MIVPSRPFRMESSSLTITVQPIFSWYVADFYKKNYKKKKKYKHLGNASGNFDLAAGSFRQNNGRGLTLSRALYNPVGALLGWHARLAHAIAARG